AASALIASLPSSAHADFTCSTIVRSLQMDPDGRLLTPRFANEVATNAAGDAMFIGRPFASKLRLYLYPGSGTPETVAAANTPAPNGGFFRAASPFHDYSINDSGDLAFLAGLSAGEGVFVRRAGVYETAAATSLPSPNGGFFGDIMSLSQINASGQVAFAAEVSGAPAGVFLYDSATDTLSTVLEVDDVTASGRELCEFRTVGLGDSGSVAVRATSKLDCENPLESALDGVFFDDGVSIAEVALEGTATPIGGTTYAGFDPPVFVNAADKVGFVAQVEGVINVGAIFLFDPAGPAVSNVVTRGDSSPAGGAIGKIAGFDLTDDDRAFLRATLTGTPERFGVFAFDGTSSTVLVKSSPPPTDVFGVGSVFTSLSTPAVAGDGSHVVL